MPSNISVAEKLQERIKELSCLYKVSSAVREHNESVEDTFEKKEYPAEAGKPCNYQ